LPRNERFRRTFPGLIPQEAALWRRWLVDHDAEFDRFDYNVAVGKGVDPTGVLGAPQDDIARAAHEQYRQNTRRRIDVVGYKQDETWLFEVEEFPGTRALGQLVVYETLYEDDFAPVATPTLALICVRISDDTRAVTDAQGILVWQLGAEDKQG
jgi:hypothetical protein